MSLYGNFWSQEKGVHARSVIVAHLTLASQRWFCAVRYERVSKPVVQSYDRTLVPEIHPLYSPWISGIDPTSIFLSQYSASKISWMGKPPTVSGFECPRGEAAKTRCACSFLYHHDADQTWFISDNSRSLGRVHRKTIFRFFTCLAQGARILPYFSGIIV